MHCGFSGQSRHAKASIREERGAVLSSAALNMFITFARTSRLAQFFLFFWAPIPFSKRIFASPGTRKALEKAFSNLCGR